MDLSTQRQGLTIRAKLAVLFAVLIAAISLFVFFFLPAKLEEGLVQGAVARAQSIADMTAFSVAPALAARDLDQTGEALNAARQNTDLLFINILDNADSSFASFGRGHFHTASTAESAPGRGFTADKLCYITSSPVRRNGRDVGTVQLGLSLAGVRMEMNRMRATVALASLIILVIGLVAVFGISTLVTRPLSHMVRTIEDIARGNLSLRASVRSHDEVGTFAGAFNKMVDSVEAAHRELASLNKALEERVAERTQELQKEIGERKQTEIALRGSEEQIKLSLREKELLLKEVHHRVKNNLQVISSLLSLPERFVEDQRSKEILRESQHRVRSIASIHEMLYGSADFARIDFAEYIRSITGQLFRIYAIDPDKVCMDISVEPVSLGIDLAIPCGLLINELVANAMKHAFPDDRHGLITVGLHELPDGSIQLSVADDGIGLPAATDVATAESVGFQLVTTLIEQLNATLEVRCDNGTEFVITF